MVFLFSVAGRLDQLSDRREIETLLGTKVYLALWVKPEPKWTRRPKRLKSLGYY